MTGISKVTILRLLEQMGCACAEYHNRVIRNLRVRRVQCDEEVWIGLIDVVPDEGCEILEPGRGAFVNFLTLASSESEYRIKVGGALRFYRLRAVSFEDVRRFVRSDGLAEEVISVADELEKDKSPAHVRYATFHTYPRLM